MTTLLALITYYSNLLLIDKVFHELELNSHVSFMHITEISCLAGVYT